VSTDKSKKVSGKRKAGFNYVLERQIGFLLRLATQRHAMLFGQHISGRVTPQQLSTLVKLLEHGTCWQTQLGRMTAMDVATMKGVVDRLVAREFVEVAADPADGRRIQVTLTSAGKAIAERVRRDSIDIHNATLAPLTAAERERLITLLTKLVSSDSDAPLGK
jgi:DNA-binding MarR family transcriptional regulator